MVKDRRVLKSPSKPHKALTEVAGDYLSVSQRAEELGLAMPYGLAVPPQNFETVATPADFMFAGTT